jgi:hypothetical protein
MITDNLTVVYEKLNVLWSQLCSLSLAVENVHVCVLFLLGLGESGSRK